VKRFIELVLIILVINSIIFSLFISTGMCYGKGELNQSDRGAWYVYVYGPSVCGFNEVYIDNPERFSDILIPQNIGMEVFFVIFPPDVIFAYWGPRNWDFTLIMSYNYFEVMFALTTLLALIIVCATLVYFVNNRKNYLYVNKL
jgi:hypothetical protein